MSDFTQTTTSHSAAVVDETSAPSACVDHLPIISASFGNSITIHSDLQNAVELASNDAADATKSAYATAMRDFAAYAGLTAEEAVPADMRTIAAWVSHLHSKGMKASSIDVKISTIAYAHRAAGHIFDRRLLTKLMSGIRREAGSAVKQVLALMIDDLKAIVDGLDISKLAGIRDRALLLVGFAAAMRRSELVSLDIGPNGDGDGFVEFVSEGLEITLRRSEDRRSIWRCPLRSSRAA